jgi:hypothetical protein
VVDLAADFACPNFCRETGFFWVDLGWNQLLILVQNLVIFFLLGSFSIIHQRAKPWFND